MNKDLETRIIILRGHGLADVVIAARLGIAVSTVKSVK